jgi:pimeloyl-ACP methyl ester carboxylesterase
MEPFGQRFHVLAPSLRHCYPEQWDGRGDFSVARHARDLAIVAEHIGAPLHVIGHSRGGAVALALAIERPDLVRSLVLADPGGLEALLPDTPEGRRMREESAAMFDALRRDLQNGDPVFAARRFAEALGGAGAWERRSDLQRQVLLDNIATGPSCAERPHFARETLAQLAMPILLLTGARSPARYALMLSELARRNRNVRDLVVLPDAAHAMHRENPAAFNDAVLRFLATA